MKKYRMWWGLALAAVAFLSIASRSVLAVPLPETKLVISRQGLPLASAHQIPPDYGVRSVFLDAVKPTQILLSLGEDGIWRAFSNRSTHRRGPVVWHAETQRWLDPDSWAMWDRNGRPVAGPAPRGLDHYPVTIVGDSLLIDLAQPQMGR